MVPISDSLSNSLRVLSQQIAKAEGFLKKQPGADKAFICLEAEDGFCESSYLTVIHNTDGECRICVREEFNYVGSGDLSEGKPLEDYPVSIRINLCDYIGQLLEAAVAAQEEVAENATEAANAIEQALARAKGEGNQG